MKKLTGPKKIKTAVFISGKGSNLNNLIKFSKFKNYPYSVDLIISNTNKAKGLKYSKKYGIEKKIISYDKKVKSDKKILYFLKQKKIKLICLAGFMKILSSNFVKKFKGNIINIHPSLLPKYKGLNSHIRAIKNGEKFSGCSVHHVTSKLDSGKIILQKKVKISKKDTAFSLAKKVLKIEHLIYPAAIKKILN
jgi:phosphoribosylglycinamide formyltransferase-1